MLLSTDLSASLKSSISSRIILTSFDADDEDFPFGIPAVGARASRYNGPTLREGCEDGSVDEGEEFYAKIDPFDGGYVSFYLLSFPE